MKGNRTVEPDTDQDSEPMEPSAPVMGGMRWRTRAHDYADECRRRHNAYWRGYGVPPKAERVLLSGAEAPTIIGPRIVSAPPDEGRAGEEYVYPARALDDAVDGFNWYLEKGAPGMVVDRYTGAVSWTPADGGRFEVVLCAATVHGRLARQSWTICVRKAAAVRHAVPVARFHAALRRKALRRPAPPLRCLWREARRRPAPAHRPAAPPAERPPPAIPLRI
jgi:hypothetical protein